MEQQDIDPKWHESRRVQVTHIVGTVVAVVALVANIITTTTYINKIESRVTVIESRDASQREREAAQRDRDDRQDRMTSDGISLLRSELQYLRQGMERLLERGHK